MTLATSGTMSIGGSTQDRSINLELKRAATATSNMNETSLRDLADVSSGAISMSNFYGKTIYKFQAVNTLQQSVFFGQTFTGYAPNIAGNTLGSTTDSTCDLYSNTPTWGLYHVNTNNTFFYIYDTVGTPTGNAGWTTLHIYNGQQNTHGLTTYNTFTRSSLSYTSQGGARFWDLGVTAFSISDVYVTVGFIE